MGKASLMILPSMMAWDILILGGFDSWGLMKIEDNGRLLGDRHFTD